MRKEYFAAHTDDDNHEYVRMATTEVTQKNPIKVATSSGDVDNNSQRMYGPGVNMLKLYTSKLHPDLDRPFSTRNYVCDGNWNRKESMGKNTLAMTMQTISKEAGLS